MLEIDDKNAFLISSDIKDWQAKYADVENLPIEFYLKYKNILSTYKELGKSKKDILSFFCKIAEDNKESYEFVNEIIDLIEGYCRPDFKVW